MKKIYLEFGKTFDERIIYDLLFNLRHVIHIPSFRIVNLLCCSGNFSNITLIEVPNSWTFIIY